MKSAILTSVAVSIALAGMSACGSSKSADDQIRAKIVTEVVASGVKQNFHFDESCVKAIIDQLSAADIQAFRVNFNSPTLSAEGQSIGAKIVDCDASKVTTTS
jgi:hypothetical protein